MRGWSLSVYKVNQERLTHVGIRCIVIFQLIHLFRSVTAVAAPVKVMPKVNSRDNLIRGLPSFGERIGHLSVKRQELIRPIHEKPRDFVLLSIRDVAQKLSTDPATVLRIVRSMGFPSYREFKLYIHELSIAGATSLEGMRAIGP